MKTQLFWWGAVHPVPHSVKIPVPVFNELPSLEDEEDMVGDIVEHDSDVDFE